MERNKKIFIFIVVALIAIVTAFLIYYFFSLSNTDIGGGGGGETPGGSFPTSTSTIPRPPGSGSGNNNGNGGDTTPGGSGYTGGVSQGVWKPILRQITTVPTSGGVVFERGGISYIRYMERAKGNVYETDAKSIKADRLSNTTIAQIYEAFWNNTGNNLIARFLKDGNTIQTFSANIISKGGGEGELRGEFLTNNIKNLVVSPSKTQIFYLITNADGISGVSASFDGKNKVQIFDSRLQEWIADWPKENTVTVTSKAGANSDGLSMFINTGTGKKDVVLSGIKGLTTLTNSDTSKILYSVSSQGTFMTRLFNVTNKTSSLFSLTTLPEKCVWSKLQKNIVYCAVPENIPGADYPESWYQGITSFKDELWKIDTGTGSSQFIMNLGDQSHIDFDAINLSLDNKENFILLTNKNDLNLWEVQLLQ